MRRIAVTVLIAVLTGCAGSPVRIGMENQEQLAQESDAALINAWAFDKSKNARTELERRGTFTAAEWQLIDQKKIAIGCRESVVYASWGSPTTVNTTTTSYGVHKQLVYSQQLMPQYVYVENGVVTSMQGSQ